MRIDMHTHTFPDSIAEKAVRSLQAGSHTARFSDGTAAGLQASSRQAGLDLSVVLPVATAARQVSHINSRAALTRQQEGTLGITSFGAAHPDDPDWRNELDRVASAGLRGIKIHPPYQGVDIDDPRYLRILERAGELNLLVVTHAGLDIGLPGAAHAVPEKIRSALRQAGPVRLICAHMGGWRCWERVCDLLADTSVCLDTAFSLGRITPAGDGYPWQAEELQMLNPEEFCKLIRAFGADRILFGSDSPWADQAAEVKALLQLPLTEAEQTAVLGGNAARLLGLS